MRIQGTLSEWNEKSGSGAITPARGGPAVPVALGAFARNEAHPQLNERLSFELALDKSGNTRARAVRHVDRSRTGRQIRLPWQSVSARDRNRLHRAAAWALLVASAAYLYSAYHLTAAQAPPTPTEQHEAAAHGEVAELELFAHTLDAHELQ